MVTRNQIAIIAVIVTAIVGAGTIYAAFNNQPDRIADFQISVNPISGSVLQGGVTQITITVKSIHNYDYDVSLSAAGHPSGMIVNPQPPSNKPEPAYTSNVIITVTSNVPEGDYPIAIKGTGADGKEHTCTYTLTVKPQNPHNSNPIVNISPVGPVTLGVGQVQEFTATASGGSGLIHYQWYLDGSAVGSDSSSYSYTAGGGSHLVSCKVTDSASTPVMSSASNTVTITVPTVNISFPIAGSSVSQIVAAQGTSQNIPSGQVIWAIVYIQKIDLYFPMPAAAIVQQTGSWQTPVTIGGPNDTGLQFDIIMVGANQAGQASLIAYNQDAEKNHPGDYPGIPQLPAGIVEYSKITVTRLPWVT